MLKSNLIVMLLILGIFIPTSAFAQGSIKIGSYEEKINSLDSFFVFGSVKGVSSFKPVELTVIDPDGQIVYKPKVSFDAKGNFKKLLDPTLPSFKEGTYTVIASHGEISQTAQLTFTVIGGSLPMPEIMPPEESSPRDSPIVQSPKEERPSAFSISANAIIGSTLITVVGTTQSGSGDVTFTVTSPNGNLIAVDQVSPSPSGDFSIEIITGGPLWEQDGFYTVTAHQGTSSELTDTVEVEIRGGAVIPEFGPIAMIVLFIAISAVIVISAKHSRFAGLNQSLP